MRYKYYNRRWIYFYRASETNRNSTVVTEGIVKAVERIDNMDKFRHYKKLIVIESRLVDRTSIDSLSYLHRESIKDWFLHCIGKIQ